ncbi:MAG: low molecular weight protein-tyrosine-phosphatase [Pseudomonadota bacterium]
MAAPRILFVCLGNICRSPTADGVARAMASARGLDVVIDSAGTGAWHVGDPPNPAMQRAASAAGYNLSGLRARVFTAADFAAFDVIYAMDRQNRADIEALRPAGSATPVHLFREHDPEGPGDVPDPYYEGGHEGVVRLIERTVARILDAVP